MKLTTSFLVLCVALLSQLACTGVNFPFLQFQGTSFGFCSLLTGPRLFFRATSCHPVPQTLHGAAVSEGVGDAFFVESLVKPVAEPIAALAPAAGAVPSLPRPFNPLKLMLASLGIPVEHLIDGSRKCVAELGPEAVGAVKTLLGALTFFG
ncbi:Secretoglobin family 3A member 1 [Fukomys damarensis]|uniref:Secretoglobin family 3A member 1 n=1 Tax=Fukomys damarensis TaxID=885580 RepID=A0A091DQQ2_FUKDA|nr:Secretoglobin family 3A member 1 [Fukomys damarensis]